MGNGDTNRSSGGGSGGFDDDSSEVGKESSLYQHRYQYQYYRDDHQPGQKHQDPVDISGVFGNETGVINHVASGICLEQPSTGSNTTGKVLFTATQWQELERQMMIYKYIMASIPVPPQLLIPLSTQSNSTFSFLLILLFFEYFIFILYYSFCPQNYLFICDILQESIKLSWDFTKIFLFLVADCCV
ncbi:putative transcription factor interactor and regulator C3H-WRC/GRF family [Helianthus debilis subsp. tardiflorus]